MHVSGLEQLTFFAGLNASLRSALAEVATIRELRSRQFLYRFGQPCTGIYVVLQGRVKQYRASRDGREQILGVCGRGAVIGGVAVLDGGPHICSAYALEPSRVLWYAHETVADFSRKWPEFLDSLARDVARQLRSSIWLLEQISLYDVPARVAAVLIACARERGALRDGGSFQLPLTQPQIAGELATTRESVARAMRLLNDAHIIAHRGAHVRILDAVALQAYGGGSSPARQRG